MKDLISGRVSYDTVNEKGICKKVQEEYMVEAVTFSEAEFKLMEVLSGYDNNPSVEAVRKEKINDILLDADAEFFFRCTVAMVTVTESMKEKKTRIKMLVAADDVERCRSKIKEWLEDGICGICVYEIESIVKTKIVDVLLHEEPDADQTR